MRKIESKADSTPDSRSAASSIGTTELRPCTLRELLVYFVRLGTFGFGGPIALTGYMQRDLVEERRWISKQDYLEGLALAQLAPGPLAAQLAIYLGWVRARVLGATLVSLAFILPSFIMVLALSGLYLTFGGLSWMQGAFYGIGAAVIAIIARSALKLVRITLAKDRLLWLLFAVSALVTAWTESEIIWLFLLCGALALFIKAPPRFSSQLNMLGAAPWLIAGLHGPASAEVLWKILGYFAEAGAFVFGSGLAIVPFLHGGVVNQFQWLTERQFLDAVAVAMITPGPVVITVAFIGYLVAGFLGATAAAIGVFLPCYLFVIVPAPYYRRFAQNRQIKAFVDGVTAAATGAIAGAAFVLGRRAVIDLPTALIALITLFLMMKAKKIPEPLIILAAGLAGLILKGAMGG
ncbi:MAG TPA: chromate transporter [Candidatus Manganitrophaceae bacterium]|nr:chromate transporter [Candidatus Manganitrophaceae bacterium]